MIRILQQDNRATKAIFAIVIGAAIVTMVITLVPGIFTDGPTTGTDDYATVRRPGLWGKISGDSVSIKTADVQRQAEQQMQQQNLPPFYLQFVMSRAGQIQVERAVLQQQADKMGLQVSDDDLKNFLRSGPYSEYIFPGGKFVGEDQYINFVETYFRMPIADFEAQVKSDLEIQRLQALVTGGVTVNDAEVKAEYLKTGTKVKFDYAVISAASLAQTINPSDADLQAFFKQNAARYATAVPEQRKITFFSFDANNLPNGGVQPVSDAEVQAYYNAHQDQYKTPEEVKTRHILITVAKGADAKTDAAAKAKAEDILKQVKAGGNFADLAKKNSDDPGSKDQGGELPLIPTAQLDPTYAKAAMALNPGQTSDVVRSQFGYHIIQTEQKQAASVKTLAEVKPSIVEAIQAQKSGAAAQAFGAQLVAQAKKDGLQKTADAHGLHVQTTDFLGKTGVIPSLPDSSALLSAAFGAAKGAAPQVVSTGEGYAIFVVDDVQAAHATNFADYKPHILDDYRQEKTPELLNAQLIKLSDRAKALGDLHKAAAEMKLDVKSSDLVGRDAQVTDIGSMGGAASVAFSLPKGGISGPINEGANGAVLQLTDKQEPTADDITKNFAATKDKLLDQKRQEVFSVFIGSLMDRYEKANAIVYAKKPLTPLGS
ncbi:peptidylprolyl isomerase [Granulicella sp. 5B5]|uniref:peptidyl-prolyl cis-trans isomerase n=1 Tax=Granulicella sp. 5B5 TaxID=1617967 RepID=UPI0015F42E96|nr:peptidyl-prolyl cis-trans isomerase [Granulicella sp. 5B5]QMV17859.1 peptidylprolyl isomerase [Granulicella sp. 5B5]